ncbi:unnamed protein product [Clonostachys rhizophaga]|uniref:Uncharacterized protein n=1 Tax=Clonostachys rhizophaga TaxID=160324 RepID=A0A9N9YKL8_9HYPO|nr:unnamed protein product [Clonostachys rhizophaga]
MVEVVWLEPDPENHRGHPHHRHNYGLGLDFRDPSPAVLLLPLRASTNTHMDGLVGVNVRLPKARATARALGMVGLQTPVTLRGEEG